MTPYKSQAKCAEQIPVRMTGRTKIIPSATALPAAEEERRINIMKFKRTSAALLAAALAIPSVGIYASAAEDEAMKKELTYVKQRIEIPKEYSEFNYRTSTENNGTRYNFTWEKKDSTNGERITVSIVGKVIKSAYFSQYYSDENEWKPSFAKLSDAKLLAAAKKYIKELNPTIYNNVKIDDDSFTISLYGNEATLRFKRVSNDIDVTGQTGYVTINKNTGDLIRYNFNWINGATFSDSKGAISQEKAEAAYQELFPVELVYTLDYDWETKERTPHLIYRQTKSGQINAFTGKLSTYEDYGEYGSAEIVAEEECADDANPHTGANKAVTFTQEEIEKLEKEDSLIKADKELDDLKKLGIFYIPDDPEVTYQYCSFNEQLGAYVRNVSFSGKSEKYIDLNGEYKTLTVPASDYDDDYNDVYGSMTYNAETGDLMSFDCWAQDNGTSMKAAATDAKAKNYLKKIVNKERLDNLGELTLSYEKKQYDKYDNNGKPIGNPRITSRSYTVNRMAYGIKCDNENAAITISNNGLITSFSITYYDNVKYPKPDNIISESEAYKSFFKQVGLGLKYRCAYNTKSKKVVTALVYASDSILYIDAFTGKRTNYNGTIYDEAVEQGEYADLEGSKYKTIAEKLKKYGITLMDKDGKLDENKAITAGDFSNLMQFIGFYGETGYKEDYSLNRQAAAKILVTGKYGKEVAEMTSIFKNKFSDVKASSKYIGYIAIADASGLMTGSNGKFRPTAAFTRGDALKFVYNYLSK